MSNLFKTTDEQKIEAFEIAFKMNDQGLPTKFVADCTEMALEYLGTFELMKMWSNELNQSDRDECIADLQELIDDRLKKGFQKEPITEENIHNVIADIVKFKKNLKNLVNDNGGIVELSKKSGIPQPSLSRFFNSASRPRVITLKKIAKALGLTHKQILTKWSI